MLVVAGLVALQSCSYVAFRHRHDLMRTRLHSPPKRSTFVLTEVETLGIARSLGWKVHMRCANGYREGTRSMRRCVYREQPKGKLTKQKPQLFFVVTLAGEESI